MFLKLASYEFIIEKSKFIGLVFNIKSVEEFQNLFNHLKTEYKKATHYCYAYSVKNNENFLIKASDDGEPKGVASIPLINAIQNKKLNNVVVFIIRYFGGKKLGKSGLYRAYNKVALETLKLL